MRRSILGVVVATLLLSIFAAPSLAGIKVYEKDEKSLTVGARIQLQYANIDPDGGESSDRIFFRRLRPYVQGTITENWMGKIQFDFGEAEDANEVAIKDAYFRYSGFKAKDLKLTIGNSKTVFSREYLTSSKYQTMVGRTFVGDHNFGAPDRQLGLRLDGKAAGKKIWYALAVGGQHHDPDVRRMDFDTPVNNRADWNEGIVYAGRIDFHPMGEQKFSQTDFDTDEFKLTISAAGFGWSNDDDNNSYTDGAGMSTDPDKADLDSASGLELSAGLRGRGLSVDAEVQKISGDTIDSTFTGGVYLNGSTDLDKAAVEVGYMVVEDALELAVSWDSLDADGYADKWQNMRYGINWYWNRHNAKLQLTYTDSESVFGVVGDDSSIYQAQAQFVF